MLAVTDISGRAPRRTTPTPRSGGTRDDRHRRRTRPSTRPRSPSACSTPAPRCPTTRWSRSTGTLRSTRRPRRQPRVVDPLRDAVLERAEREPARRADPPGVGLGRLHRHLVRADPPADDAARDRTPPTGRRRSSSGRSPRSPTSAATRSCSPAATAKLDAPAYLPDAQGARARAALQDDRHRGGGLRRHPGRRGGPRRHAARLDARRAGRPVRAHDQQHPRRRGVAAHEVRPRRGDPSDMADAGPVRRHVSRAARGVGRLPHRHQHGQPARLRRGRAGRRAGQAGGRRATSTTSRCCGPAAGA